MYIEIGLAFHLITTPDGIYPSMNVLCVQCMTVTTMMLIAELKIVKTKLIKLII